MDRANSSQIKAVILDYGEVLCYSPTPEEWARMAGVFGVDPVAFRKLWERNRLLYDRGDLSPEAYWSGVAKDAGTQLAPEQLPLLRQWDVEMWAHENPDHGGMVEADSFLRNQDRSSLQYAPRHDPARAPEVCLAGAL